MCGIVGAVDLELGSEQVRKAIWSLRRRGPDDWGLWSAACDGSHRQVLMPDLLLPVWSEANMSEAYWSSFVPQRVVFGHTRLSIQDLSRAAHQPMVEGSVVLTFNGEIYNYVELREELKALGFRFSSTGDTEVLLKSYLAWSHGCVRKLNGFFAFVVWDGRTGELFAARDRLGQKPLYYAIAGGGFAFASEIKAMWPLGAVRPAPEPGVAARYLALGHLPAGDETFYRGIHQLAPASTLHWRPGQSAVRSHTYWKPDVTLDRRPARAHQELREHLMRSVSLRYRSDVPVGVCLSGGVDSSTLLAVSDSMRSASGRSAIHAFSAVHDTEKFSEEHNVRRILEGFPDVRAHFLHTAPDATYDDFIAYLKLHDEPLKSDGIFNQYRFMQHINAAGMRVMLSGQGADELFLGYPWYIQPYVLALLQRFDVRTAWGWIGELRQRTGADLQVVLRGLATSLLHGRSLDYKRRRTTRWLRADVWDACCHDTFTGDLRLVRDWPAYHWAQFSRSSLTGLLKDEDRNSMANGVETRLPYLDVDLVEWALTLAPDVNFREGATKHLLRTAYPDTLPKEVMLSKEKRGFYVPYVTRWAEHAAHRTKTLREASSLEEVLDVNSFIRMVDAGEIDDQLCWRAFNLAFVYAYAARRACEIHIGVA